MYVVSLGAVPIGGNERVEGFVLSLRAAATSVTEDAVRVIVEIQPNPSLAVLSQMETIVSGG